MKTTIEQAFEKMHTNPPAPFNKGFRPGFGEAICKAYGYWCEANPDATQEERRQAHANIASNLESEFPTVGELETRD